jgi:hypothetical protein
MSYKTGWKYKNISSSSNRLGLNHGNKGDNDNIVYDIYEKNKNYFPEIANQGKIESCVPTCISTLYYYYTVKQDNHLKFRISRLYLYYKVRKLYDEIDKDNGSTIEDCINELVINGAPPEFIYPYNVDKIYEYPNELSVNLSKFCKCMGFNKIDRYKIKKYLLNDDPVICGIKIFFDIHDKEIAKTGILPSPTHKSPTLTYKSTIPTVPNAHLGPDGGGGNSSIIGGHCIIIVGYDDNRLLYKFINSWGEKWGENGCGYISYDYIHNFKYADEFFILKHVSNPKLKLFLDEREQGGEERGVDKGQGEDGGRGDNKKQGDNKKRGEDGGRGSIMKSIQELFNLSINKK